MGHRLARGPAAGARRLPLGPRAGPPSLRPFLLEEAYEVYDALEGGPTPKLAEELGDLLLQIVLHAQYAAEAGVFDLSDVQRSIMTKIVRRHPHVFGDGAARTAGDVMRTWERIKADERAAAVDGDAPSRPADPDMPAAFAGLSRSLPALAYADEMQERAASLGYDWPDLEGVIDKVAEEATELLGADEPGAPGRGVRRPAVRARQPGAASWTSTRRRRSGRASRKFARRFARVERLAAERQPGAQGAGARCARRAVAGRQTRGGGGSIGAGRTGKGTRMSIGGGVAVSRRWSDADPAAPGVGRAGRPEVGGGLGDHPRRRHARAVRRDHRGPHPAAPARQGHRLGDRGVLDAAGRDLGAQPARERPRASSGGRTHEIQRLIGRSLRGVVDTAVLGERTVTIDCDVLQADGGTRCASITGGWIALSLALRRIGLERAVVSQLAAVSVGIVDGAPLLDLDYPEDSHAEVDFNVVATDAGTYVEVQGTAEGKPFGRAQMDELLALADSGIAQLFEVAAAMRWPARPPRRPSAGDRPTAPGHPLGAQAPGAADAAPPAVAGAGDARRGGHRGRGGRGRGDLPRQRHHQGPLLLRAVGHAHARRRLGPRGGRARWRPGRATPSATPAPDATDAQNNAQLLGELGDLPRSGAARATGACWRSSTRARSWWAAGRGS